MIVFYRGSLWAWDVKLVQGRGHEEFFIHMVYTNMRVNVQYKRYFISHCHDSIDLLQIKLEIK